jgi:predicted nucleic acid-binding protein
MLRKLKAFGQPNIALSDVTCAELLFGARNKSELIAIKKDIKQLNVLPITSDISSLSVQLVEKYSLSHKLSFADALIAATSTFHKIPLYTLNVKDFKFISGIELYQ